MITVNRYGFVGSGAIMDEAVSAAYGGLLDAQVKELSDVLDQTNESIKRINNDPKLTSIGKIEQMQNLGVLAWEQIKKLAAARRRKLDLDLKSASDSMPTKLLSWQQIASSNTGLAQLQRHAEIRTALKCMELLEQESVATTAAENGDLETILAISTAPAALGLLPKDRLQSAINRYQELNHPEEYKSVQTVQVAIQTYESNVMTARNYLRDSARLTVTDDPVMK